MRLAASSCPGRRSRGGRGVEVPAGKLRREVCGGTLGTHGREGHLHEQRLAFGRIEIDPRITGCRTGLGRLARLQEGDPLHGLREFGHEPDLLVLGPARRVAPAAQARAVVRKTESRIGGLVPAAAVLQVEDQRRLVRGREGITVESHTGRGRHLGRNAVAGQRHRVVPRAHDLLRTVGIGPEARLRILLDAAGVGYLPHDGHHRNVEQVADARTAQMRVRESDDRRIRLVVARAPVPLLRDARGAELHHAEGNVRPDEDMSVAARADFGIDPAGQRLLSGGCRSAAGAGEHEGRNRQKAV